MNENTKFGQFISDLRSRHSMKGQELAEKVGISRSYLWQLEHGVRLNPDADVIIRIVKALDLTKEESAALCGVYARETEQLAPDIAEYIKNCKAVQKAIRYVLSVNAADEVWKLFIEQLNKLLHNLLAVS